MKGTARMTCPREKSRVVCKYVVLDFRHKSNFLRIFDVNVIHMHFVGDF